MTWGETATLQAKGKQSDVINKGAATPSRPLNRYTRPELKQKNFNYFPAIVAIKHNPYIKEMSERLRGRGKCPMQIIGAAMRKLVHLAYGVLKTGRPFDPGWAQKQKTA
jgi:hypothetical protein